VVSKCRILLPYYYYYYYYYLCYCFTVTYWDARLNLIAEVECKHSRVSIVAVSDLKAVSSSRYPRLSFFSKKSTAWKWRVRVSDFQCSEPLCLSAISSKCGTTEELVTRKGAPHFAVLSLEIADLLWISYPSSVLIDFRSFNEAFLAVCFKYIVPHYTEIMKGGLKSK
jgi:hypothetical protein